MTSKILISQTIAILALAIAHITVGPVNSVANRDDKLRIESLELDRSQVALPCRPGFRAAEGECSDGTVVRATVRLSGKGVARAELHSMVSGGRVVSVQNGTTMWDLSGVTAGTYSLTVNAAVGDGVGSEPKTVLVNVAACSKCITGDRCPVVAIVGPRAPVSPGQVMIFTANVSGASSQVTYNWTISAGTIVSGQGSPAIEVKTEADEHAAEVTATVEVVDPTAMTSCRMTATESAQLTTLHTPAAELVDDMRTAGNNCEEGLARMDNFTVKLAADPTAIGVVILYADDRQTGAAVRRKRQLSNYLKMRKYDNSRFRFIDGPAIKDARTQFWLVPAGAEMPELLPGVPTSSARDKPASAGTEPYLFGAQYSDEIPECGSYDFDLESFADELSFNPTSRGLIVISETSAAAFRSKLREITKELAVHGITLSRVTSRYKHVAAGQLLETVELWIVPRKKLSLK